LQPSQDEVAAALPEPGPIQIETCADRPPGEREETSLVLVSEPPLGPNVLTPAPKSKGPDRGIGLFGPVGLRPRNDVPGTEISWYQERPKPHVLKGAGGEFDEL